MTGLEFASSVIHALAWPVSVLVFVLVLRRPIVRALSTGPLRRLKLGPGGIEAEWDFVSQATEEAVAKAVLSGGGSTFSLGLGTAGGQSSAKVTPDTVESVGTVHTPGVTATGSLTAELGDLARRSPRLAVRVASEQVEARLYELLGRVNVEVDPQYRLHAFAQLARSGGVISEETERAIEGLAVLSAMAARFGDAPTTEQAQEFLALADAVMFTLAQTQGK